MTPPRDKAGGPIDSGPKIELFVPLEPVPWSVPTVSSRGTFKNPRLVRYQAELAQLARVLYRGKPLSGPIRCGIKFYLRRPKSKPRKGSARALCPDYPIGKPDLTNLVKAAEDALNGILWGDDSQIVSRLASWPDSKGWANKSPDGMPGLSVKVVAVD